MNRPHLNDMSQPEKEPGFSPLFDPNASDGAISPLQDSFGRAWQEQPLPEQTPASTDNLQAAISKTLGWAARNRVPEGARAAIANIGRAVVWVIDDKAKIIPTNSPKSSINTRESASNTPTKPESAISHEAIKLTFESASRTEGLKDAFGKIIGGHDRVIDDPEAGIFGAIDGVGSDGEEGGKAAYLAQETIHGVIRSSKSPKNFAEARKLAENALAQTRKTIIKFGGRGSATVNFGFAFEVDGVPHMIIANAGDCVSYLVDPGGNVYKLSEEQNDKTNPNVITNWVGKRPGEDKDAFTIFELRPRHRLAFFTDGIAGDHPEERLSEREIRNALLYTDSPASGVARLFKFSRKHDDKGAVVVKLS